MNEEVSSLALCEYTFRESFICGAVFFNFYTFKAEGLNGNRRTNASLQTKPLPSVYGTGRRILQIACFNVFKKYTENHFVMAILYMGFLPDEEVIQEVFKLEPSSGIIGEGSFQALCKVQVPEVDWEPKTIMRVSIYSLFDVKVGLVSYK